jgi:ubiquinone/menaquinone biosynthesis C-methylase UbiE
MCCDVSLPQLEETKLRAHRANVLNIHPIQQDVRALGFESETFDVVFANALIEHLPDPAEALLEMWRVLRPGGVLALRSPDWTAVRLAPHSDFGGLCVEAYASQLQTRHVFADSGAMAPLFRHLRHAAINRSTSSELHIKADLFAEVIISSLSARPADYPEITSVMLDKFRAWGYESSSVAVETWDDIILIKDTTR